MIEHITMFDILLVLVTAVLANIYGVKKGKACYPTPKYKPGDCVAFSFNGGKETGVIVKSRVCLSTEYNYTEMWYNNSDNIPVRYNKFIIYYIDINHVKINRDIHGPKTACIDLTKGDTNYFWINEKDIGVKLENGDASD